MDSKKDTIITPAAPESVAMSTFKEISVSTVIEEEGDSISQSGEPKLESRLPLSTNVELHQGATRTELPEYIIEAIMKGDGEKVQNWIDTIDQEIDDFINSKKGTVTHGNCTIDVEHMTALHFAALYCQVQIVEKLLVANADPKCMNNSGENVLHVAVQTTHEHSTQQASHEDSAQPIGQDTHNDFPDSAQPATKEDSQRVKVIKLLFGKDRNCVNAKTDVKGVAWTALQMAVDQNLFDVVEVLLENGADPGKEELSDDEVRCSIALAAQHKDGRVLKLLLDKCEGKFDINRKSGKLSALHMAVYFSCPGNVKLLIDHEADIRTKDNSRSKKYPIHYAYRSKTTSDFVSILNLLKDSLNERDGSEQTLLHHAAMKNKLNYVRILVSKYKAEFKHKNKKGRLPIHYLVEQDSSFDDFKELVHLLNDGKDLEKSVNIQDKDGLTPLHLAIIHGHSPEYIEVLLDEEKGDPTIKSFKGKYKGKGVSHFAISAQTTNDDFKKLMEILAERKFDINAQDANGKTMLHYAIELKKFSKAHIIMDYPFTAAKSETTATMSANPFIADLRKKNCLHCAFINCCDGKLIRRFLERCEGLDDAVDDDGKRPSQYLCESSPISAFKVLKRGRIYPIGHYKEAFTLKRYDIVKVLLLKGAKLKGTTLMEVIKSENEDLAKILIRHAKDIIAPLNNEFCEDQEVQSLPVNTDVSAGGNNQAGGNIQAANPGGNNQAANTGGSNQAGGNIQASNAGGNIQTANAGGSTQTANTEWNNQKGTTPFRELIRRMPDVAYEALQRNTEVHEKENKVIFRYPFVQQRKRNIFDARNTELENPLTLMVNKKRTKLLQHPVVRNFLFRKWRMFGFKYYIVNIFTYLLFLCSLTAFSLVVNNPLWNVCAPQQFQNRDNDTAPDSRRCGSITRQVSTYIIAAFTIVTALYQQLLEIIQILYHRWNYFTSLQNLVEFFLYILSFLFVIAFFNDCGCPKEWQWTVGILAMFLAWANVVFFSLKIPCVGIFVLIFYNIVKTFLEVALFSLILILGFSFILLMMFNSPDSQISAFSNFGHSFAKTATMVTGELDFDAIFGLNVPASDYVPIPFHEVSFFMWIIFIILIPTILNNMLTSLAVGDARVIREEVKLELPKLQVENILEAEGILELVRIRKYRLLEDGYDYIRADVWKTVWRSIIFFIWGEKDFLKDIKDFTYEERRIEEQEEMKVEAFDEVGNTQDQQHYQVIEKLDQLFYLVKANEEHVKKLQIRMEEREEMKVEAFNEEPEDPITEKLNQLMCLVESNEEQAKKRQELLEKLAIHLNLQVE